MDPSAPPEVDELLTEDPVLQAHSPYWVQWDFSQVKFFQGWGLTVAAFVCCWLTY